MLGFPLVADMYDVLIAAGPGGDARSVCRASYIHTSIVYIALVIFVFKIYASDEPTIGSPGKVCHRTLAEVNVHQNYHAVACVCTGGCQDLFASLCFPPK